CLEDLDREHCVHDFALGDHDRPDYLQIPEKLYGREREIEMLLASFDRIVNGGVPELVLVSGYSGIGKSSVVNELQPVLVPAWPVRFRQVRSIQARHSLFDVGAGLSEPCPTAARQTRGRACALARQVAEHAGIERKPNCGPRS